MHEHCTSFDLKSIVSMHIFLMFAFLKQFAIDIYLETKLYEIRKFQILFSQWIYNSLHNDATQTFLIWPTRGSFFSSLCVQPNSIKRVTLSIVISNMMWLWIRFFFFVVRHFKSCKCKRHFLGKQTNVFNFRVPTRFDKNYDRSKNF